MTVANVSDVPAGHLVGASLEGIEVVVAKVEGRYHAVGGVCPHAGCSLATDGELAQGTIECGCHGSTFDLETGAVVTPPAEEPISVYEVRVEGNAIQITRSPTQ